jgi:hypothetical protein
MTCYSLASIFNLVGACAVNESSFCSTSHLHNTHSVSGLLFTHPTYHFFSFWPSRSQPQELLYNSYTKWLNNFICSCVIILSFNIFVCVCQLMSLSRIPSSLFIIARILESIISVSQCSNLVSSIKCYKNSQCIIFNAPISFN